MLLEISQNLQENTCVRVSFLIKLQPWNLFNKVASLRPACNFIKKETLAQVFSCEFCEICKNTSYKTPPVAASIEVIKLRFLENTPWEVAQWTKLKFSLMNSVQFWHFDFLENQSLVELRWPDLSPKAI